MRARRGPNAMERNLKDQILLFFALVANLSHLAREADVSLVRRFSAFRFVVVFAALAIVGTACSGNGEKSSTAGGRKQFTIGFTNPLGSNDQLTVLQNAIVARAKSLGAKVIPIDDQLDPDKQIADIDQLISQQVDGIIVFPLDAKAVVPAVERAKDAGIKTIGINASLENPNGDVAPFDAAVNQGTEQMASETAKFVAQKLGGKGNVLGVGLGSPVPVIQFQVATMKRVAEENGLTWLDTVENPSDDAAGAEPVVEQALLRFPKIDAIMPYNEPSALGATSALQQAGRHALVTAANGTDVGLQLLREGKIAATWDLLPWKQGVTYVDVMLDLLNGKQVPKTTVVPVKMLTKDNLASQVNWQQAVKEIEQGTVPQ